MTTNRGAGELIAEIDALYEKATKGPVRAVGVHVEGGTDEEARHIARCSWEGETQFYVALRNAWPVIRASLREDGELSERQALEGLINLLLETTVPIGPMRSRKDYPPQLEVAIRASLREDGMVRVPREPTDDMIEAGAEDGIGRMSRGMRDEEIVGIGSAIATWKRDARYAYKAMLAAIEQDNK